jgi:hypothetical protein
MMWVAVAAVALKAYSSYSQGRQEEKYYKSQAQESLRQARIQATQYEQQANRMLRASIEAQAAARARAAAGGVDPFSGSAGFVQDLSAKEGIEDFKTLSDTAQITRETGAIQGQIYEDAGRYARRRGLLGAATAIAGGIAKYGKL